MTVRITAAERRIAKAAFDYLHEGTEAQQARDLADFLSDYRGKIVHVKCPCGGWAKASYEALGGMGWADMPDGWICPTCAKDFDVWTLSIGGPRNGRKQATRNYPVNKAGQHVPHSPTFG